MTEYTLIEEKLNRNWIWSLIGGFILLLITFGFIVFCSIYKFSLLASIIIAAFILFGFVFTLACFASAISVDKYTEVKKKIKLEKDKKKNGKKNR